MSNLYGQKLNETAGGIATFLPFLLIGLIFYLLIIRPQSSQKKKQEEMLNNLKKGDKILTRGGILGKIVNFQGKGNTKVTIEVSPNNKIVISRAYIIGLSDSND